MFLLKKSKHTFLHANQLQLIASTCNFSSSPDIKLRNQSELTSKIKNKKETTPKSRKFKPSYNDKEENALSKSDSFKSKKSLSAKNLLQIEEDFLSNEHIEKYKIKESDRLKLMNAQNKSDDHIEEKFNDKLLEYEKEYLNKASFEKHNNLKGPGEEYLTKYPSLKRVSTDPHHLTILHTELADKIAKLLYEKYGVSNTEKRLFVECNPGVGIVTKALLDTFEQNADYSKTLILFEKTKFKEDISELIASDEYEKQKTHLINFDLFRSDSKNFTLGQKTSEYKLITDTVKEYCQDYPPVIYGIVPWKNKAFMNLLFSNYITERLQFQMFTVDYEKPWPEFVLYISGVQLSKFHSILNEKNYLMNNRLVIINRLFCEYEILDEQDINYFFPYPQPGGTKNILLKYSKSKHVDINKMYLVRMKFKSRQDPHYESLIENKHLLNRFLSHILQKSTMTVKQYLKLICRNKVSKVLQKMNEKGAMLSQGHIMIKDCAPLQIYFIFKVLLDNSDLMSIGVGLEQMLSQSNIEFQLAKETREYKSRTNIKKMNKDFTGQFVLPKKSELD